MSNVTSVLAQAKALSEEEQQELLTQLEEYLVLGSQVTQVTKEVKEMRFSKGRVCCYCNGTDVARNGVQRYLCRNFQKSFSYLTNSANELERLYDNRIGEHSILCSDSHKSYILT